MEKPQIRLTIVGKTGVGKSATGNTILGRDAFESKLCFSSQTEVCQKATGTVHGFKMAVVDTPGLYDTSKSNRDVAREVGKSICFCSPGPHVILIVVQLGRFTKEEMETVEVLQTLFGEQAKNFTMIVMTHGDQLKKSGTTIDGAISPPLRSVMEQCRGGYHLLDNTVGDDDQVIELLEKINALMQENGGRYYTNEMFEEAERAIEAKKGDLRRTDPHMNDTTARAAAEESNDFILKFVTRFLSTLVDAAGGVDALVSRASDALWKVVEKNNGCVLQ